MSWKLNIVDQLLERGRHFQQLGRSQDAVNVFQKLVHFRNLTKDVAEEVHSRLAELQAHQGQFQGARRHLGAALALEPTNPDYHYQMALAVDGDPDCSPERALRHYQRCVELDPEHPEYLVDFGCLALELGKEREGLKALRQAAKLAPNDLEILRKVAAGLRAVDRQEEAGKLLRAALFRNGRDARFMSLWKDHQFQILHQEQQVGKQRVELTPEEEPAILPFVRPTLPLNQDVGDRTIRHDGPMQPRGPHQPVRSRRKQKREV